jgi:hypothetical protein
MTNSRHIFQRKNWTSQQCAKSQLKWDFLQFTAPTALTAGRIILRIHGIGMLAKMANKVVAVKRSSWTSMFQSTKHVLQPAGQS